MTANINSRVNAVLTYYLSKQPYLEALPRHGFQILVAFLLFTSTSWMTYYFIAPSLLSYSRKKKLANDEHARVKWGHMAVSFLHAVIVCGWSLYLWYDNSLAHSVEERVMGYSQSFGEMFAFSVGYFLWDVVCCIWYVKTYGRGFLVHAFLGLLGLLSCYRPFMMYPTSRFLLFEFSTLFVDMHWFLEKLGYGGTWTILFNDACGLVAYLGVRIIFGSYLTYRFFQDLYVMRDAVPLAYSISSILANSTTHALNFFWFYRLLRSIWRRTMGTKGGAKSAAKATGHVGDKKKL